MVCVSQGRCVTAVLCVTGPLCHRAVVSQAHCTVCVSQGRCVTALKASFIGLLLQYWLILKTRDFHFLSLYLAQFIDFPGGSLAVAVDLEDAYNRVQFKLLMELLRQYGVSLTLTRWLAAALQERKVAMRLGNWISTPQQLTMGLPQGSPLSPVLYNVYTKGLADLKSNGLSRVLTLADDGLIYKTSSDISTAVTAVQEQLEKVSHWCQETESEINPSKAQACGAPSTTKQ